MRLRLQVMFSGMLIAAMSALADPVELQDRLQLADGLFRRSMFELAAREYATLADMPGVNGLDNVLFRLGECYRRTQHPAEAEAAYKRLADACPTSANVHRANLQRALILMDAGKGSLDSAAASFEKLAAPGLPSEVRSAALYHWAETLEKLNRPSDALARYEQLGKDFPDTDYGMYSGLRVAWILTKTGKPEDRRRAMGIYLDLAHKTKDPKVSEEAFYFAAQVALVDLRYEESANLFQALRAKYPSSPRVVESALSAGWANFYAGRFKEASDVLNLIIGNVQHPLREEVLYVKANCLRQLEQRAEAVTFYDQQLAAFPDGRLSKQAWYEKLTTLYRDGKYLEVLKISAQGGQPPEAFVDHVYWMSSESAIAVQQPEIAVQNCRLLVDKCPKSPFVKDALYRLGWLLQKQ